MEIFINILINSVLSVIDVYLIEFSIINTHKFIKRRKIYILFIELVLVLIINMNIWARHTKAQSSEMQPSRSLSI